MSTRSAIAVLDETTGKIRSVYCHWDGYPEYNGAMLSEHYTDAAKVEELVKLGSISLLAERLEAPEGKEHSFDKPAKGVVIAYHRDRGEDYVEPDVFDSEEQLVLETERAYWAEFVYLFKGGQWHVYETQGPTYDEAKWCSVTDALCARGV